MDIDVDIDDLLSSSPDAEATGKVKSAPRKTKSRGRPPKNAAKDTPLAKQTKEKVAKTSTPKNKTPAVSKKKMAEQYEKRIYDLEQLIDIARSFSSAIDTDNLLESISFSCMAQLHVADAGIFVLDFLTSDNFILQVKQDSTAEASPVQIPYADSVIAYIADKKCPVTLEELAKNCTAGEGLTILEGLNPTLIVPLLQKNRLTGLLFLGERFFFDPETGAEYTEYEKSLVLSIASLAAIAINNATLIERSSTDMMTQLKLKYYFFNILTEHLEAAFSQEDALSVIMFDIDFFKHFNDTYGHECGDYVLKKVAFLIKSNLRKEDLASRYGGEEFTVLLNNTGKELALQVAERIRKCIESYDFVFNDKHMHVTISSGVAVFDKEKNPIKLAKQLVNQADQGLYMSKRNGRNQVTYADPAVVSTEDAS